MLKFAKAHAYGNDFLYVQREEVDGAALDELARRMCDRHAGIGADGLIVYRRGADAIDMRLFNADGSRAEISGNGVRGLAALLLLHEDRANVEIVIGTEAGSKRAIRIGKDAARQTFRTFMGEPRDVRKLLPIEVAGESVQLAVLNMGNPQCVVLGSIPDEARFRRLGQALERHVMFPEGTNVEFAEVEAPNRLRILIWERGVGPTSSSGTGSCAALVAAASFGGAGRAADVVAPGGSQRVDWKADGVYLTGWAEVVCVGEWVGQIPRAS